MALSRLHSNWQQNSNPNRRSHEQDGSCESIWENDQTACMTTRSKWRLQTYRLMQMTELAILGRWKNHSSMYATYLYSDPHSNHVYSMLMLHDVQFRSPRMPARSLQIFSQNHFLIPTYVIRISLFPSRPPCSQPNIGPLISTPVTHQEIYTLLNLVLIFGNSHQVT